MTPTETPGSDPEKRVPTDILPATTGPLDEDAIPSKHHITDETGALAASALDSAPLDAAESRSILAKLDRRILPFLCITYALQFIDKTSLGYSSVYGIIKDNKLVGQQYSWASSIFYFGYLVAEYPGVAVLQRFPVAKFLGVNIVLWGMILMTTAACSSFAGLASVRFLLGVTEATISPGFVAVTGMWWTRQEQAGRSALWVSFLGVGSFVGTLLAYGIGHITGSLSPWKYIFLILGALTVVWGVVFTIFVPDGPAKVTWLTEREKVVAVQRVAENQTGTGRSRTFVKAQVIEAAKDPAVIILGLISFVNAIASGGLAFGSLIIQGLGFSPLNTTLMNLPLSTVQVVTQLGAGFLSSKIKSSRLHVGTVAMIPPVRLWLSLAGWMAIPLTSGTRSSEPASSTNSTQTTNGAASSAFGCWVPTPSASWLSSACSRPTSPAARSGPSPRAGSSCATASGRLPARSSSRAPRRPRTTAASWPCCAVLFSTWS